MVGVAVGLLGTAIGSFINVCCDRLPAGGSVLSPPSHCDSCGRRLQARDMIPIASYLALRGRCRSCGARIPIRNLLVELATGLLYGLAWWRLRETLPTAMACVYVSFLVAIVVIDCEHHLILNRLTYPAILLALLTTPLHPGGTAVRFLAGGAIGFGVLFLIALAYRGGMGMGDVKLGAFVGLILGYPKVALALFISFVLGGLVAGVLVAVGILRRKDPIAFGPFLAIGAVTAFLFGEPILSLWRWRI